MALVSVVVVFVSVAAFAELYSASNHQTPVLVTTRTIQQGQPITGDALGQAGAALSGGVTPIPVSEAPELSGKRAAVTIPAGTLLTPADVTVAEPVATGDAVVGLALKEGQLPASGVEAGDQVMIVQTASPGTSFGSPDSGDPGGGGNSSTGVLVPQARVFQVDAPPSNSSSGFSLLVSVEVSSTLAAAVSTASAADQVSLVLLPATEGQGS